MFAKLRILKAIALSVALALASSLGTAPEKQELSFSGKDCNCAEFGYNCDYDFWNEFEERRDLFERVAENDNLAIEDVLRYVGIMLDNQCNSEAKRYVAFRIMCDYGYEYADAESVMWDINEATFT